MPIEEEFMASCQSGSLAHEHSAPYSIAQQALGPRCEHPDWLIQPECKAAVAGQLRQHMFGKGGC